MTSKARFDVFPMVLPTEMGPRCVPDRIEFAAGIAQEIDLSQLTGNGWIDFISGVYCDNFDNSGDVTLICAGSNQKFIIPAGCAGYYPLLLPNDPKVTITHSVDAIVTFQWYNVPIFPLIIPGPNSVSGGSNINIAQIGGVAVPGGNLPIDIAQFGGADVGPALPVAFVAPTITDYSDALTGADQEIVAAGNASHYLLIQNPVGNADVTVNIAGGDASASGFILTAGGQYENTVGLTNAIHVDGTAAQNLIVFAG